MKNLILSIIIAFCTFIISSCNNSNDPIPQSGSGASSIAGLSTSDAVTTAGMQVGNPIPDHPPIPNNFEWKLVKSVTLPYQKGLNLTSPFSIVNEDAGDISWGTDGGCYSAIKTWKVTKANLKIVDVKTVTPTYLKTLTFNQGMIYWAPAGSYSWTDYMPVGTVIACKNNLGKYQLVVVKHVFPLELDIYSEYIYRVL